MFEIDDSEDSLEPFPYRRTAELLRPVRRGLTIMVGLSTGGVLVGLVPPLLLGALVNALIGHRDIARAGTFAALIGFAIVVEAIAYIISDGLYASNAARVARHLRSAMFLAIKGRFAVSDEELGGLPALFISDAESIGIGVSVLDGGSMLLVEFVSAFIALAVLAPWTMLVVGPELLLTWFVTQRMRNPVAKAGERRQEELERLSHAIVRDAATENESQAHENFDAVLENVLRAETRVGWLEAINLQGSGGLAKIGPIAALAVAAFTGIHQSGTLVALYLLAQRAFTGFDGLVDLRLSVAGVHGPIVRCFNVLDRTDGAMRTLNPDS